MRKAENCGKALKDKENKKYGGAESEYGTRKKHAGRRRERTA